MRRPGGFTLLEMVVATAMVAVLAGSLYASLYTALKARRQALGLCDDVRRTHAALDFLQADLESAVVPDGVLAGAFEGVAPDQASSDEPFLSFHAVANDSGTGAGGIQLVEYSIEPSADGADKLLVRRVTRNLLATQQTDPPAEIICRGLQQVTVNYFDTTAWQQEWSSADQDNVLPKAVEVLLSFAPESASNILGSDIYLSFVLKFILAFGLGFLLPVFLVGLNVAHVMPSAVMIKGWRVAVFLCFLFTAVMTPTPDPWTMIIMALPMIALYFLAVGISYLIDRRRAKADAAVDWLQVADDEASAL